ncbi:sugar transferase [Bacillus sp. FJAT-29790]|uniref:sugar transferase n=1 Tax=Bacillus sp. FJAT-29790 TaxID=1895002 RepID=UPI001C227B14|nr:sugar transferase [Bacillus sp. FJAT-29790]MBU8880787.1 sugar transferase [Bacillus sp. FJAT-29790]
MKEVQLQRLKITLSVKRIFDIVCSLFLLISFCWLFLLLGIAVKVNSKGPVFFKQVRIGRNEKEFYIYKFRTMVKDAEKSGKQITVGDDRRITKVGMTLRKYKLDEFPQLYNVLKGDMSFVGPRPEVPRYTKLYNEGQRKVFLIRPGITDYASIKYRNESRKLSKSRDPEKTYIEEIMADKLVINLQYVENLSFVIDLKILFLTFIHIFKMEDTKHEDSDVRPNRSI